MPSLQTQLRCSNNLSPGYCVERDLQVPSSSVVAYLFYRVIYVRARGARAPKRCCWSAPKFFRTKSLCPSFKSFRLWWATPIVFYAQVFPPRFVPCALFKCGPVSKCADLIFRGSLYGLLVIQGLVASTKGCQYSKCSLPLRPLCIPVVAMLCTSVLRSGLSLSSWVQSIVSTYVKMLRSARVMDYRGSHSLSLGAYRCISSVVSYRVRDGCQGVPY